jgi:hypothetical protein
VNGNPVLALDYFSLWERLAQSLVRSIASPFDYARVPSCEGTGPPWFMIPLMDIQSRSRCRRAHTYLGFRVATKSVFHLYTTWSISNSSYLSPLPHPLSGSLIPISLSETPRETFPWGFGRYLVLLSVTLYA